MSQNDSVPTPAPLRCGIALTGAHEAGQSSEAMQGLLDLAATAEAHGFSDVWVGDHLAGGDRPWFSSGAITAALAAHCQTIGVGWIVIGPLRVPSLLADELATIDAISNGRLSACIVAGWRRAEYDLVGAAFEGRTARAADTLSEVADLWDVASRSVPGQALSPAHPFDWWFGGSGPRAARAAARLGVGFLLSSHVDSATARALADEYRAAWGHTHPPRIGLIRQTYVDRDDERAWDVAGPAINRYYDAYRAWGLGAREGLSPAPESDQDDRLIVGSPKRVARELEELRDTLDASMLVLRVGWPTLDAAQASVAVALLGDRVLPALAGKVIHR